MSDSNNKLNQVIEAARQDAQAQQVRADALAKRPTPQPRGKQIFTMLLLAAFAMVLLYQFPRFSEPYTWPDPASNPTAAEADLIAVVGLIEAYRISQGKYPVVLSQVAIPQGLAALISESALRYMPSEQAYTLDWTLPNWHATYDSQTEKLSVQPVGKK
ncbi:MAG: hypothetical protein D4R79_07195 [Comamonadaceae bacterium]|nr:MAG: hypothetical protein D4R79_07195 [Comamonadaceae bacterium]